MIKVLINNSTFHECIPTPHATLTELAEFWTFYQITTKIRKNTIMHQNIFIISIISNFHEMHEILLSGANNNQETNTHW